MEKLLKNMQRIVLLWYATFVLIILTYPIITVALVMSSTNSDILVAIGYIILILFFITLIVIGILLIYLYSKVSKGLNEYILESDEFENKRIRYITMRYAMYRPSYHRLFRSKTEESFKNNLEKITPRINDGEMNDEK